jgi:hypothetical protein
MEQYAVVTYDDRPNDDNEVEIKYVTDSFEYANKLAFHYAKKELPPKSLYGRTECRIVKNYNHFNSVVLRDTMVDYRICEVEYDDECEEYEKYDIVDVRNLVSAVVKFSNYTEKVEEIDESIIYHDE